MSCQIQLLSIKINNQFGQTMYGNFRHTKTKDGDKRVAYTNFYLQNTHS